MSIKITIEITTEAGTKIRKIIIKPLDLAEKACAALDGKKGSDISLWDVRQHSGVTDFYIVVTGTSPPHLKAMFDEVQRVLKQDNVYCYRRAGEADSGWLVLDYIDVVIHMFSHQNREYYAIEDLWQEAPRLK